LTLIGGREKREQREQRMESRKPRMSTEGHGWGGGGGVWEWWSMGVMRFWFLVFGSSFLVLRFFLTPDLPWLVYCELACGELVEVSNCRLLTSDL
jgi:hypothetical protein